MKDRIKIIIDNYLENNRGIQKKYIEKIIYITDTDRCFIDNDYIYFGEKDKEFRYEDDGIYKNNIESAKQRNKFKSKNLSVLNSASEIYKFLAFPFSPIIPNNPPNKEFSTFKFFIV